MPGVGLEASHVNLVVEVTDVADDGVVLHLLHVVAHDDVLVTGGGDEDVDVVHDVLDGGNLEAVHGSLEGADGVNLGDDDAGTGSLEGHGGTLADVTEAGDEASLGRDHDVGGAHDAVGEGVAAAVEVVKLALGDGIVDVDGGEEELASLLHLVQALDAGGGLLGDADAGAHDAGPALGIPVEVLVDRLEDELHLGVVGGGRVGAGAVLLELDLSLVTLCLLFSGRSLEVSAEFGQR